MPPQKDSDVVCPHFLEFKWANGCHFDCAWCFLKGTFRIQGTEPKIKDENKIRKHFQILIDRVKTPQLLNAGELSDALMFGNGQSGLTSIVDPLLKHQSKHKLLLTTKTIEHGMLCHQSFQNCVIVSFSLNAPEVAKRWEHKAPTIEKRIEAAALLVQCGYPVRVRIDPIVPVDNWKVDYTKLISMIFDSFIPERITLGSLRGLQSTINFAKDKSWVPFLTEKSNWGKKVNDNVRYEIYNYLINLLKEQYNYTNSISLCKESVSMWNKLPLPDYKLIKCNCLL